MGALVGWAFGPAAMRRFVDDRVRTVTIICERAGVRTVQVRPWNDENWEEYREGIDSYLADGGVPPRPLGYVWYLVLPPGSTPQAIWAAMGEQERIAVRPAQLAPLMRAAAARFARPGVWVP